MIGDAVVKMFTALFNKKFNLDACRFEPVINTILFHILPQSRFMHLSIELKKKNGTMKLLNSI